MYFSIFLIILSSVQPILCSQSNVTVEDTCSPCTISWIRRKRAQAEYTRWRANQMTTEEFIVKVLDDDLTTALSSKVMAINIQPVTKTGKRVIIGGTLLSPITSDATTTGPTDYTRFILPTTIPAHNNIEIRSIPDELIVLPEGPLKSGNQNSLKKHIHRDENPPSGPQFLARTHGSLARQYAPVTPVSFNRGAITPVTPRSVERFMYKTPFRTPTRTSPVPEIIKPTRTTFHDIFLIDSNYASDDQKLLSRTSLSDIQKPFRTLSIVNVKEQESIERLTEDKPYVSWRRIKDDPQYIKENESELSYNVIFVNEEDKEKNSNVESRESTEIDNDKDDYQYEVSTDTEVLKNLNESVEDKEDSDNSTESESNDDNNYSEKESIINVTTHKSALGRTTTELQSSIKDSRSLNKKRKRVCSMIKLRQLNFNSPRTLPEIVSQLKQWAETSPVAKWVDITNGNYTTMENPIYMMIVDDPSSGQIMSAKKTVLVVAGIQGRDHHAVAAAMYLLYQLIERSEAHSALLTKYRFWIIPIFNPDGYDYSMTFPHKREWTKNLRQKWEPCKGRESCEACTSFGLRCTIQACYGVNLDRNFEYQWIPTDELRSEHPCGALYAGERQLSEPETRALTQFLRERRTPLFTFIAFKEGDVLGILYPYSHTRKRRAFDNLYRQRASRAASAAYSIVGRPYVAGQTSEFLPLYAGGIEDWVDGHLGIDNTYTVMMFRPSDSYNSKLITEHVVHEAYAAVDTLLMQSVEPPGQPAVTLATSVSPRLPFSDTPILATSIFFAININ